MYGMFMNNSKFNQDISNWKLRPTILNHFESTDMFLNCKIKKEFMPKGTN
jgi:hypothetical protein